MKVFLVGFVSGILSFCCSLAIASPSVGDIAIYVHTDTSQGTPKSDLLQVQLTDYNQNTDVFHMEIVIADLDGSNGWGGDEDIAGSKLLSDTYLRNLLESCASQGGTLAETTVPAGTFQTCEMPVNNDSGVGNVWYGIVPFGIVKSDLTLSGVETTLQLKELGWGK